MKHRSVAARLLVWFQQNARDLPWRRTHDPYAIWVSEIMLQQTQVKAVIPYWQRWMRELPSIKSLAQAAPERIHKLWEGLGYYTRVRNLQKAAQVIVAEHRGVFPQEFDQVLKLPGIGRYTAGAICSIAFNQPTPILDGNVIRVLTRLKGIERNPSEPATNHMLWKLSEELVQEASALPSPNKSSKRPASDFNQALMELGALVCTPRQPRCEACPVAAECVALRESRQDELPANSPRVRPTQRTFVAFVVRQGNRWLVHQRPPGIVNGHMWEFPNAELTKRKPDFRREAEAVLGFTPQTLEPALSLKHSITRYRITLQVFRTTLDQSPRIKRAGLPLGHWLNRNQLDRLAFASAHRKILERLCPS